MAGQFGLATETTPGTGVTPTKFFPVMSMSQEIVEEKLYRDDDIRSSQVLSEAPRLGRRVVKGKATMKLPNVGGVATLLKHVFGTLTSTTGPVSSLYTHTYALGGVPTATIQGGIEDAGGTVRPFTHVGCAITDASLKFDNKGWVILEISWAGMDYTTATALATASYPTIAPFTFVEASLTLAGTPVAGLSSFQFALAKGLATERYAAGSRLARSARRQGRWLATAKATADFEDLTMVTAVSAATQLAAVVLFSNGVDSLTVTGAVVLDGGFPSLTSNGIEAQPLDMKFISSTFTPVLVNGESSAA